MERIEELELAAHRGQIVADVKNLVEKYRAIFDWDVPDIDQGFADKLTRTGSGLAITQTQRGFT